MGMTHGAAGPAGDGSGSPDSSGAPGPGAGQDSVPVLAAIAAPRPLYTRPSYLAVLVLGGALGTLVRYLVQHAAPAPPGEWPWATFTVNVVGSFILGALLTALARSGPDRGWRRRARIGAGTGFCGGLTTYSSFVVEIDSLLREGWATTAISYAIVSVGVGVGAALVGVLLMRAWPRRLTATAGTP